MKIAEFNTDEDVLVIAEIGNCHEGSKSLALEMIAAAGEAGVGAVKFQTIVPERLVSAQQTERIAQLKRFQLSYDDFADLSAQARNAGLLFISTPFDLQSVDAIESIVDAYKVSSGDNTFYPLYDCICSKEKPILISLGLADFDMTVRIRDYIAGRRISAGIELELGMLHCVCSYPVPDEQANLAAIRKLSSFGVTAGYSDHTLGIDAAVASVSYGARIIEKHFTLDKNYSDFRDHQLSADPSEMKELVRRVRRLEVMEGSEDLFASECEDPLKEAVRRSIVASRELKAGDVISMEDITWVRPGGGFCPGRESEVIGCKLKCDLQEGQMILSEHFQD